MRATRLKRGGWVAVAVCVVAAAMPAAAVAGAGQGQCFKAVTAYLTPNDPI